MKKQKRNIGTLTVVVLALLMIFLTACGKSEFMVTENTEKRMVISATNAEKDAYFMVGTLVVEKGEQIQISSDLPKGSIKVEIIQVTEEQNLSDLSEPYSGTVITANLHLTDSASGSLAEGSYMLKATCLETATGSVVVEIIPAA